MKVINENPKEQRQMFNAQEVQELCKNMDSVLNQVQQAKKESMAAVQMKKLGIDLDDEDMDSFKAELSKLCKASSHIMEFSGQLGVAYGAEVAPLQKQHFLGYFVQSLKDYKNITEDEVEDALCFFNDYIQETEHTDFTTMVELVTMYQTIAKHYDEADYV